jgi:hypothetical protein
MTTDASFGASQPSSMGIFGRGRGLRGPPVSAFTNAIKTRIVSAGQSYDVYQFNTSGTITFSGAGDIDALVVGGGGSGGSSLGGGGGAGRFIEQTVAVTATSYSITVGAGGATVTTFNNRGFFGMATIAVGLNAGGGGGGASYNGQNGLTGAGSGGGAGYTAARGLGTNGFPGGLDSGGTEGAGGGGGAGGSGFNGTATRSGQGGLPLSSSITGTALNYAAGGVGGQYAAPGPVTADYSIAGIGGWRTPSNVNPTAGQANTGSGGGGGASNTTGTGGAGGSGVAIIRVAV